jgi:type IV secretory pathway VirB10-like protein
MFMRTMLMMSLLASLAAAQQTTTSRPSAPDPITATSSKLIIPSGTKVPLVLKQALSTKNAREGDPVYAQTTFPVVLNDRIVIPAGTYVQGKISNVKRAGRLKGRAEVLMHFTTLIYPSGYTVILPGALENVPGAEKTSMKGEEGTIRQDSQTGQKVGTVASTAGTGAVIGGLSRGGKGAAVGAGVGGAVGTAIALLTRGNDVKLDAGTTLEMVIQREVPLDANRIPGQRDRFRSASEY